MNCRRCRQVIAAGQWAHLVPGAEMADHRHTKPWGIIVCDGCLRPETDFPEKKPAPVAEAAVAVAVKPFRHPQTRLTDRQAVILAEVTRRKLYNTKPSRRLADPVTGKEVDISKTLDWLAGQGLCEWRDTGEVLASNSKPSLVCVLTRKGVQAVRIHGGEEG